MRPNTPTIDESFLKVAKEGKYEQVKELLSEGAYVDALDENKHTALYHAVTRGNAETAEFLLLRGANPDTRYEDKTLIKILTSSTSEDPNLKNNNNRTNLINLLYTFGADVGKESVSENPDKEMKEFIKELNNPTNILNRGVNFNGKIKKIIEKNLQESYFNGNWSRSLIEEDDHSQMRIFAFMSINNEESKKEQLDKSLKEILGLGFDDTRKALNALSLSMRFVTPPHPSAPNLVADEVSPVAHGDVNLGGSPTPSVPSAPPSSHGIFNNVLSPDDSGIFAKKTEWGYRVTNPHKPSSNPGAQAGPLIGATSVFGNRPTPQQLLEQRGPTSNTTLVHEASVALREETNQAVLGTLNSQAQNLHSSSPGYVGEGAVFPSSHRHLQALSNQQQSPPEQTTGRSVSRFFKDLLLK
jgi:hypothetical protein